MDSSQEPDIPTHSLPKPLTAFSIPARHEPSLQASHPVPEQGAAQGALSSAEPLDEEARPAGEEAEALQTDEPSGNAMKTFQHVVFIPHAVTEMRKAREALARLPASARLFLDVFAGFHAPVATAVAALGLDHFQPFDLDADSAFELLLQICWSGIVGSAFFAPPCKAYSRLKLLPGGPPALRTPEHLDGIPGLSPSDMLKVTQSKAIHGRGKDLFEAVATKGGTATVEQPPGSMAWLEPDAMPTLRKFRCHVAWVDACMYDMMLEKSWAFASTSEDIKHIASLCCHQHRHQSIRGTKDASGGFLSSSSAEYPPALAQALASVFAPKLTSQGHRAVPLQEWASLQPDEPVCDGAGRHSSADRTIPVNNSPLQALSNNLSSWLQSTGLRASISAHVLQQKPDCPLSEEQQRQALDIVCETLGLQDRKATEFVEPGQPLRLNLLEALARRVFDTDTALIQMLRDGVTTFPLAFSGPRSRSPTKTSCLWKCVKATGPQPRRSPRWFKPLEIKKLNRGGSARSWGADKKQSLAGRPPQP